MISALLYLLNRALFRIREFFFYWYVGSFYIYTHFIFSWLEKIDRVLAFKITLRYLFHPLYQDRTFLGYVLGFIFRSGRLAMGGIIYALIIAIAVVFYLTWMAIPLFIVYKIIFNEK